jgi:hypothetical protein
MVDPVLGMQSTSRAGLVVAGSQSASYQER